MKPVVYFIKKEAFIATVGLGKAIDIKKLFGFFLKRKIKISHFLLTKPPIF